MCYFKGRMNRIYIDSFGQVAPMEIQKYLNTRGEHDAENAAIQRNTDIAQHTNTHVCGNLCLFVLTLTSKHPSYQYVLYTLNDEHTQDNW